MNSQKYRLGVTPDCPLSTVYLAGQDFPKMTEKVSGSGPSTKRTELRGVVRELTDDQVSAIKKAAKAKFVRLSSGKAARARLFTRSSRGFKVEDSDIPVSHYLYMEPTQTSDFDEPRPKTLADEAAEAKAPAPVEAKAPTKAPAKAPTKSTKRK